MKRALLIYLSLILALGGWSAAFAQDGFYVIPTMKPNYAPVPKTGQTSTYATGDDGELQKGVASPTPRFTDNNNGTVADNLTGLIWLKNVNYFVNKRTWVDALSIANNLKSGDPGLTDGSKAGDWRLPNVKELQSLLDYGHLNVLPVGHPFTGQMIGLSPYWSSTINANDTNKAWYVYFIDGAVFTTYKANSSAYVWCVRGGS
jgi:hypothetical protein